MSRSTAELPWRIETPDPASEAAEYYALRIETSVGVQMHWHNFYELDFVSDGSCRQILNGVERPCGRGTLTILSNSDFHAYPIEAAKGERLSTYSFHFSECFPDADTLRLLRELSGRQLDCSREAVFDKLCREFAELFSECEGEGREKDALVRSILAKIVITALRACRKERGGEERAMPVCPELQYIEKNFRLPITEGEVAATAGFSPAYFSRLFRQRYGITFQTYLLNKRLQYAYRMIRSSSASLADISAEAGFNSHSYFCRCFKNRYGVTANCLRERLRAREPADPPKAPGEETGVREEH